MGLVVGYALIGACWLFLKTTDDLERKARLMAQPLLIGLVAVRRARQHLDAARVPADCGSLVQHAQSALPRRRCPILTALLVIVCWRGHTKRERGRFVLQRRRGVRVRVRGARDLVVSVSGAVVAHVVGRIRVTGSAEVHLHRHRDTAAVHPRLHRVLVLHLPRKTARRRGVSPLGARLDASQMPVR